MKTITTPNAQPILDRLCRLGIPHAVASTNKTDVITVSPPCGEPYRYLCTAGSLTRPELSFIKQTRKEAEASQVEPLGFSAKDIFYYRFRDLAPGRYEGVTEVDVNSAYWEIARQKGIISEQLYKKGLNDVSKMARLVALGSLATVRHHYVYDLSKGKYKSEKVECNERTRSYFFDVAKQLDEVMARCIQKHQVLFYWVDAFILKAEHAARVRAELEGEGLPSKVIPLQYVEVSRLKSGRRLLKVVTKEGKIKPFIFGNDQQTAEAHIKNAVGTLTQLPDF